VTVEELAAKIKQVLDLEIQSSEETQGGYYIDLVDSRRSTITFQFEGA
jgi:hypothetical protein